MTPSGTGRPSAKTGEHLPNGVVRLSDPNVKATPVAGPAVVAPLLAHVGRVTLLHALPKAGKSTLLSKAVAAVTRGRRFLEAPLTAGDVLWIGEELPGDVKRRLTRDGADLKRVLFIRSPSPDRDNASSLPNLLARFRPRWVIIDTWAHYLNVRRLSINARVVEQARLLSDIVDLARQYGIAFTISHHDRKSTFGDTLGAFLGPTAIGALVDMLVSLSFGPTPRARRLISYGRWRQRDITVELSPTGGYRVLKEPDGELPTPPDPSLTLTDRLLLHLLQTGSAARPPARELAVALNSGGGRYQALRAVLVELAASKLIDRDRRPGTPGRHMQGYALTQAGRARAETIRDAGGSRVPSSGDGAMPPRCRRRSRRRRLDPA